MTYLFNKQGKLIYLHPDILIDDLRYREHYGNVPSITIGDKQVPVLILKAPRYYYDAFTDRRIATSSSYLELKNSRFLL